MSEVELSKLSKDETKQLAQLTKLLLNQLNAKNKLSPSPTRSSSPNSSYNETKKRKHKKSSPPRKKQKQSYKTPATISSSSSSSSSEDHESEHEKNVRKVILKSPSTDEDDEEEIVIGASPTSLISSPSPPHSPSPPRSPSPSRSRVQKTDNMKETLNKILQTIKTQCEETHTRNAQRTICQYYNTKYGCKLKIQTDGHGAKCLNQRSNKCFYHGCLYCYSLFRALYFHRVKDCKIKKILDELSITID